MSASAHKNPPDVDFGYFPCLLQEDHIRKGRLSASLLACVSLRSLKYSYFLFDTWIDGRNEKFYNEVS